MCKWQRFNDKKILSSLLYEMKKEFFSVGLVLRLELVSSKYLSYTGARKGLNYTHTHLKLVVGLNRFTRNT